MQDATMNAILWTARRHIGVYGYVKYEEIYRKFGVREQERDKLRKEIKEAISQEKRKDCTERTCLNCGKLFESIWKGNRLCQWCNGYYKDCATYEYAINLSIRPYKKWYD